MSENLKHNNSNEEVDLGQLFNAIGRLFGNLFEFIGKVFKGLFSTVVYALKPAVRNFKIIIIVALSFGLLGYVLEKFQQPVYYSDMLVRPFFESKYQLANNVNYFNALIASNNHKELAEIFEIDSSSVKNLLGFEITIGPETQNDLLRYYNDYIKSIDSTLAADVSFESYIENRDILAGKIFSIKALSMSNDIFTSLEKGFVKTFENEYSKKLKRVRDTTIHIRKAYYEKELKRVDSLQNVYLEILKKESDKDQIKFETGGLLPVTQTRTVTREYELFQKQQELSGAIRDLDEKLVEESDFYDILTGFEEVGLVQKSLWNRYLLILPLLAIGLLFIIYACVQAFKFIETYE